MLRIVFLFAFCALSVLRLCFALEESEVLFKVDFDDHPIGVWETRYDTRPMIYEGFAHIVADGRESNNHYAEIRPGYTEAGGTGDLNWRGHLFNQPIPALGPNQALELSFDFRVFTRGQVEEIWLFNAFFTTDVYIEEGVSELLMNHTDDLDRVGFGLAQSSWTRGGVSPAGTLALHLSPERESGSMYSINFSEIGILSDSGGSDQTESVELHMKYVVRRLEEEGRWESRVDVYNRLSGAVWSTSRQFLNRSAYRADRHYLGMSSQSALEDEQGLELDNICCRVIPVEGSFAIAVEEDVPLTNVVRGLDIPEMDENSVPLFSIPKVQEQIEAEIELLNQALQILPERQIPLQFQAYGFHSSYLSKVELMPEEPRWTVEFYQSAPWSIDELVLVPAIDRRFQGVVSYGFPKRFRIVSVSATGEESVIWECMDVDVSQPDGKPLFIAVPEDLRSIQRMRVEVYRGVTENESEFFALDEFYGIGNSEIVTIKDMEASSILEVPPYWGRQYLTDHRTHLGLPLGPAIEVNEARDFLVVFDDDVDECVIELDLGSNVKLGWANLFPAAPSEGVKIPGYGFPGVVEVELIPETHSGIRGPRLSLPRAWASGSPDNNILRIPMYENRARWIRMSFKDLSVHNNQSLFGLGEIRVYKGGKTYQVQELSLLSGFSEVATMDAMRMVDGLSAGRPVMFQVEWLHQIAEAFRVSNLLDNRNEVSVQLQVRWREFWIRFTFLSLAAIILVAVVVLFVVLAQRRKQGSALRAQISSDLHDDVGALLGCSTMAGRRLEDLVTDKEALRQVGRVLDSTSKATQALRDIVWVNNEEQHTLRHLLAKLRETASLYEDHFKLHFSADDLGEFKDRRLGLAGKRDILLLVKEALNNIRKHAEADNIWVTVSIVQRGMRIAIRDDGRGYDVKEVGPEFGVGFGLLSMQKRAQHLGCDLRMESELGKGTEVELTFTFRRVRTVQLSK